MYKFVIKGIDGKIKYTSLARNTIDDCQKDGSFLLKEAIINNPDKYHKTDSVDVIPVLNLNYLLVQQY